MKAATQRRRGSLILDVRSRAALIDGQRVELSPKQFELLTELAAHPGEPVRTEELIRSVWPDSFGMTPQEVRWHIFRLRQAIGDDKREIVANRRGFGYLIDLAPQEIQLLDHPQVSLPKDVEGAPSARDSHTTQPQTLERPRSRRRKAFILLASGSALILLAGTWVAASRRPEAAPDPRPPIAPEVAERAQPTPRTDSKDKERQSQSNKQRRGDRGGSRSPAESGPVGDAFTSGSTGYPVASSGTNPSSEGSGDHRHGSAAESKEEKPPPPPPQPNAELFHLYNPDTGDHFLTTSSSTANQKQASGYELIVEGGVFTDQVKGTVAVALDDGTAYIFKEKGSTSGTSVAPLYRMEKDSDFFYTSSSAAANQAEAQGWTRATVGYVAT